MILTNEQKEELAVIWRRSPNELADDMQAIVDAYEKMRPSDSDEWISVKERLPKEEDAFKDKVLWCHAHGFGAFPWDDRRVIEGSTHWKPIRPPVITPPTLEDVERPKFEEWFKLSFPEFGPTGVRCETGWEAWMARAKSEQSAKA